MSEALVVGIVRQAIELAILVSLPMLLAGLIAGVAVSVFQTVTSIQDNVLAFIPRAAAIFLTFAIWRSHFIGIIWWEITFITHIVIIFKFIFVIKIFVFIINLTFHAFFR